MRRRAFRKPRGCFHQTLRPFPVRADRPPPLNAAYGSANAEAPGASVRAEPEEKRPEAPARRRGGGLLVRRWRQPARGGGRSGARTSAHRAEPWRTGGDAGSEKCPPPGTAHAHAASRPRKKVAPPSRVPGLVNLGNTLSGGHRAAAVRPRRVRRGRRRASRRLFERFERERVRFHPRRHGRRRRTPRRSFRRRGGAARDLVRKRKAHAARFDDAKTRASATAAIVPARRSGRRSAGIRGTKGTSSTTRTSFRATRSMPWRRRWLSPNVLNVSGARTDASGPVREWACTARPTRRAFTGVGGDADVRDAGRIDERGIVPPPVARNSPLRPSTAPPSSRGHRALLASETVEWRRARAGCGGRGDGAAAAPRRARCSCTRGASAPKTRRARRARRAFLPSVSGDRIAAPGDRASRPRA